MNAVTPYTAGAVARSSAEPALPRMSRDLALDVARMTDPDPAARALRSFDPRHITPAQREEAEWTAEQYRAGMAPVTRPQLLAWLGGINAGCRNPQDQDAFAVRLSAIAQDCGHLPAICFTPESRRALYAETRFFPSAGDVLAVLEPIEALHRNQLAALERIAAAVAVPGPTAPATPAPRSAEEAAHVSAVLSSWRQEMADRREAQAEAEVSISGGRVGRSSLDVLPPLKQRLADIERRIVETRAMVRQGGPTASIAETRLRNMEATAARWRSQLGAEMQRERVK